MNPCSCTICLEPGLQRLADSFCANCHLYFCRECLTNHNMHDIFENHQVLHEILATGMDHKLTDGSDMLTTNGITCKDHEGRVIEVYCTDHDTVCCPLCIALYHRSCTSINYITHTMADTDTNKEKRRILTSLKQNLKILHQLKASRQQCLENPNNPIDHESGEIKGTKKRRSTRLRVAEKRPTTLDKEINKTTEDDVNKDICKLDKMITKTESKLTIMAQDKTAVDDFIQVKQGQHLSLEGKTLIGKLSNDSQENNGQTAAFQSLTDTFVGTQDEESIRNKSSLVGEYDIKLSTDTIQCFVKCICVLEKDYLVIADSSNNKLKLLDNVFKVTDSCELHGQPGSMCKTGPTEVACIVTTETANFFIQFSSITEGFLTLTRSFRVEMDKFRRGICCLDGDLYIFCKEYEIKVFTKSGTVLRSFSCPELKGSTVMANIWTDGYDLIVTDGYKRIYILDKLGNRKAKITDKKFNGLYGLCFKECGEIFVCSYYSNVVFLMDKTGKIRREILGKSDGILNPQAVAYIKNSNHLVVGSYGTDKIQVFKL